MKVLMSIYSFIYIYNIESHSHISTVESQLPTDQNHEVPTDQNQYSDPIVSSVMEDENAVK